jgi:hypothetical protein
MTQTHEERVDIKLRVTPSLKSSLAEIARENERPLVREIAYALKQHVASKTLNAV